MYTGERQVIALRKAYLDAVLRQDVGFFDTDARTGDIVFGVSTDTLLVQDAIGEKVGNFMHYIATFLAGLVVGFVSAWRLALLSVAVIPAIAFAGGLYAYTLTGLTSKSRESYTNAGVVAEQVTATLESGCCFTYTVDLCHCICIYFSWIRIRIRVRLTYVFLSGRLDLGWNWAGGLVLSAD
jgi:ATP-binding cassette, subfamily B (MDR/TAP), member 1